MGIDFEDVMKKIISVEELRDFSKVEKRLEEIEEGFVFQNNKPTHVIMTLEKYEKLSDMNTISNEGTESLETLLNKIGKKVFIDYYDVFKYDREPEAALEKENFTLASRRSRSSSARSIFRNGEQIAALKNIINSARMDTEIIDKAKEIYAKEIGSDEGCNKEDEPTTQVKIGKMMRTILTRFLENKEIDVIVRRNLLLPDYSKKYFNLNFPALKLLGQGDDIDRIKRDTKGYNRYYDIPVHVDDARYLICSQWVDNLHKSYCDDWIIPRLVQIVVKRVAELKIGTDFTLSLILPEYWNVLDDSIKDRINKSFQNELFNTKIAKEKDNDMYERI